MSSLRIGKSELAVGKPIPWSVYTDSGTLLLQKGVIIQNTFQRDALLARGLYRDAADEPGRASHNDTAGRHPAECPFDVLGSIPTRLSRALAGLARRDSSCIDSIYRVVRDIQAICRSDPDASLGAVHLWRDDSYPITHLIHCAILVELMMRRLDYSDARRRSVAAAALTSNIAMLDLQETLYHQQDPLSSAQQHLIQRHPETGCTLLMEAGVDDELWLNTVLQHHEQPDGSGYYAGLKGDAILPEARLLHLADIYGAMVCGRSYRKAMLANSVLREIFLSRGEAVDEQLTVGFIKELGVYPPGSFVLLSNGETALVVKRGKASTSPTVYSVLNPNGTLYPQPLKRVCGQSGHSIRIMVDAPARVNLNLRLLWDYK